MGIIFRSLIFGNVDSADYDIYVSGDQVYNAPERAVEMVSVPGRNGDIVMDLGHWNNIEVSYPCGCFANDQASFRQKIQNFRNAIVSQLGYQRLQDTYNPDEYRLGVYASGLEVEPAQQKAGEFTITFNCKPQRYLTSGETAISVSSGDTITNPTMFEASPLLEVEGYGNITINDKTVTIANVRLGYTTLGINAPLPFTIDNAMFMVGDTITVGDIDLSCSFENTYGIPIGDVTNISGGTSTIVTFNGPTLAVSTIMQGFTITVGTTKIQNETVTFDSHGGENSISVTFRVQYTGSSGVIDLSILVSVSGSSPFISRVLGKSGVISSISGVSSVMTIGRPAYLDLDSGEAYKIDNDTFVSVNNGVSMPASLPTLAAGSNEITFDNTITDFKVVPRWWRL